MRSLGLVAPAFLARADRPRTWGRSTVTSHLTAAGIAVVAMPPEIDIANADQVCGLLCAALAVGIEVVVADLSGTVFCDVRGVRALIQARDRLAAAGAELRLAGPPGRVRKVLTLIVPDGQLRIFPSARHAMAPAG
jgi:anti-anti-sigma factor